MVKVGIPYCQLLLLVRHLLIPLHQKAVVMEAQAEALEPVALVGVAVVLGTQEREGRHQPHLLVKVMQGVVRLAERLITAVGVEAVLAQVKQALPELQQPEVKAAMV